MSTYITPQNCICDPLSLSIITLSNMDHSLRPYWVYSLGDIDVLVDLIGLTLFLIVKELLYSSAEGRPRGRPGGPEDFSLVTLKYPWSSLYSIIVTPLIGSCNFNDLPHRVAMCKYQYQNQRQWYTFYSLLLSASWKRTKLLFRSRKKQRYNG